MESRNRGSTYVSYHSYLPNHVYYEQLENFEGCVSGTVYSLGWGFISSEPYVSSIWSHEISPGSGRFRETTSRIQGIESHEIGTMRDYVSGIPLVEANWRLKAG
jgi:hypothetical protein